MKTEKPPIGIMPEQIWKENRLTDLRKAISRYISGCYVVPIEWITEYNKLIEEALNPQ